MMLPLRCYFSLGWATTRLADMRSGLELSLDLAMGAPGGLGSTCCGYCYSAIYSSGWLCSAGVGLLSGWGNAVWRIGVFCCGGWGFGGLLVVF